jgi:Mg2+ and Co2+ transporter CorA
MNERERQQYIFDGIVLFLLCILLSTLFYKC